MKCSEETTILVVDDDPRAVEALCLILRMEGYRAVGAESATAALSTLQTRRFSILLTDMQMPEMDGIELIRAARANDPQLICLVMTGRGTASLVAEAMKAGALDLIEKPAKPDAIRSALARAADMQQLRAAAQHA